VSSFKTEPKETKLRPSKRAFNELRDVNIEIDTLKHAEGSCLISFGETKVICTATIDEVIPPFLRGKKQGWVTAEYGMLPRSTNFRMKREINTGKPSGRSQEIQRLIARSLRSATNLSLLGERQIIVDCDVIQADGGTRTAAITGGYVALYLACKQLVEQKTIKQMPIINEVAAISCGIYKGKAVIDLDYDEDSNADVDANFILTGNGNLVEIQATAEKESFSEQQFAEMLSLAKAGVAQLVSLQREILS
jgi:ribonuclease PH